MPIRVFVADDHPVFVKGLTREFEYTGQVELVGTASDGEDALREIKRLRPDVALLDILMPRRSGIQVLQVLNEQEIPTRVIFLTGSESKDTIYAAIAAGAAGYLLKTAGWDEVTEAILKVVNGDTVIDPQVAGKLAGEVRRKAEKSKVLSDREYAVLGQIAKGKKAAEIAKLMNIEVSTVRTHMQNAKTKLGASTYGAAVAEAIRRGVIE